MLKRIPNALSITRDVLALLLVIISARLSIATYLSALVILLLALLTDSIDGYLARRWCTTSDVGYILDSLGDRALHLSLVLVFLVRYGFHPLFAWLIIFRDIGTFAARILTKDWHQKAVGLQWLSRLQASCLRIWLMMFVVRDGFRVFAHADVMDTLTFDVVQYMLFCTTIVISYYGLFRSFAWLIEQDHESV
jgi:phosphatidylglycerophosphate synthase